MRAVSRRTKSGNIRVSTPIGVRSVRSRRAARNLVARYVGQTNTRRRRRRGYRRHRRTPSRARKRR